MHLWLLSCLCYTLVQGQDLEELIGEVFTKPSEVVSSTTAAPPNLQPNSGSEGGLPGTGDCVCVPYYLCNNGTINTSGEGIIDIR